MDVPWNKPSSDSIGVPHWLRKPPAMEPRSCVKIQQGTWEWMHMVHMVNVTSEAPWAHWIYQPRHYLPLILSGMWTNHIPNTWITAQKFPIYWRLHKSQGDMRWACHVHMQMYACQRAQMHNERGESGKSTEGCMYEYNLILLWIITLWLCQNNYWKWPFIVSCPINSMVIFHSYVSLLEGMFNDVKIMLRQTKDFVVCAQDETWCLAGPTNGSTYHAQTWFKIQRRDLWICSK